MKYCWSHEDNIVSPMTAGVFVLAFVAIVSIVKESIGVAEPLRYWISSATFFLALFACPIFMACVSGRKYCLDFEGMCISYPHGIKHHYKWSEFSEVSLCKVHYASGSNAHVLAIRCVIGKEDSGPQYARKAKEDWSMDFYEYRHYKQVISIYYTEERYTEFQKLCPLPIKDYRYLKDI